jgi:hypothetical protein
MDIETSDGTPTPQQPGAAQGDLPVRLLGLQQGAQMGDRVGIRGGLVVTDAGDDGEAERLPRTVGGAPLEVAEQHLHDDARRDEDRPALSRTASSDGRAVMRSNSASVSPLKVLPTGSRVPISSSRAARW